MKKQMMQEYWVRKQNEIKSTEWVLHKVASDCTISAINDLFIETINFDSVA